MCNNRVGEGRACWSLGNAYVSLGNHKQALHYARKHLDISKEVSHFYNQTVILYCTFGKLRFLTFHLITPSDFLCPYPFISNPDWRQKWGTDS